MCVTDILSSLSRQESESSPPPLMEVRGVIFDMDGTLTIPVLNFLEMKAALGLAPNQDILPTVQTYPPAERAKAMAIIEKFEDEGIRKMQVRSECALRLMEYFTG